MSEDIFKRDRNFHTTQWSVVAAAGGVSSGDARQALQQLCSAYWFPLYAFVRRSGFDANQAADLTQGFFAELLRREDLRAVSPEKGRFRTFLLVAVRNYIANEIQRQKAQKRGGDVQILSIDFEQADQKFRLEPFHQQTPETVFRKQWALTLLEQARQAIRAQYMQSGKEQQFDLLQIFLTGQTDGQSYKEVARKLDKSEGAVKVAVHRLRRQFHDQIRHEIAKTVTSDFEIDQEINELFEALRV